MDKIFDFVNGDMILKTNIRLEIERLFKMEYEDGKGNAKWHAIKYLKSIDNINLSLAKDIIDSIK